LKQPEEGGLSSAVGALFDQVPRRILVEASIQHPVPRQVAQRALVGSPMPRHGTDWWRLSPCFLEASAGVGASAYQCCPPQQAYGPAGD